MLEGSTQPAVDSALAHAAPRTSTMRHDCRAACWARRPPRNAQPSSSQWRPRMPIAFTTKWLIVADLEAAPYTNLSTASTEGSRNERSPSRRDGGPRVGRRHGQAGDHQVRDLHLRRTRSARTATAPGHHRPAPSHGARSAPCEDAEQADAVRLLQAAVRARRTHAAERTA